MYDEFLEALKTEVMIRNRTESTAQTYINYLKVFLAYTDKDPLTITHGDVRTFILVKKQAGLKPNTLNDFYSAIRFFFRYVLHKPWDDDIIPRMKVIRSHPDFLTLDEVTGLIDSVTYLKHKAMFSIMYSSGLRVSELCHLHYDDISRTNRCIHVRNSKNRMDRYTILSDRSLDILTQYWFQCGKPREILFPSRATGSYLKRDTVNLAFKQALKKYGIHRDLTCHSLRHSFAIHLLEAGVDKTYIQQLLGHICANSTEVYLHVTNKFLMGIRSPLDTYGGRHE